MRRWVPAVFSNTAVIRHKTASEDTSVSHTRTELLRIMPSFTMPSFGALRTVEDADRARAAASSDSALDLL